MNKRLQQFLAAENISQSQFADTIGVARASISHILAGRNKPGFDFIERMASHYPELSLEWLITGRGRMYVNQKSATDSPAGPISPVSPGLENTLFGSEGKSPETVTTAPPSRRNTLSINLDEYVQGSLNQRTISKIIVFYSDGSFSEIK